MTRGDASLRPTSPLADWVAALRGAPDLAVSTAERPLAAVAALFAPLKDGRPALLLIRRAERRGDPWSGHVGLPGGRPEERDADARDTALRETEEEIGLRVPQEALFRGLEPMQARRRDIRVKLWVQLLAFALPEAWPPGLSDEVAEARWVPLDDLLDPRAATTVPVHLAHRTDHYPAVRLFDHWRLWGLSYRMIDDLLRPAGHRLPGADDSPPPH